MNTGLPAGWEFSWDHSAQRWYYFNRIHNITQWHPPAMPAATTATEPGPESTAVQINASDTDAAAPSQPSSVRPSAVDASKQEGSQDTQAAAAAGAPGTSAAGEVGQDTGRGRKRGRDEGWHYQDPSGIIQGPFTVDQLRMWRSHLPMDLLVWRTPASDELAQGKQKQASLDEASAPGGARVSSVAPEHEAPASVASAGIQDGVGSEPEPTSAPSAHEEPQKDTDGTTPSQEAAGAPAVEDGSKDEDDSCATELADLLGDSVLLRDWREQAGAHAYSADGGALAPTATAWEHMLLYGARKPRAVAAKRAEAGPSAAANASQAVAGDEECASAWGSEGMGAAAYAEAVLAGLPPDDEAVVLARMAAASGKTLQDVLKFNYSQGASEPSLGDPAAVAVPTAGPQPPSDVSDWESRAEFNPRTRRLELFVAEEGTPGSLYREMSKWVNPSELERSLHEAAQRKGMKLPSSVWRQLKERKLEAKKKARTLALLS